MSLQTKEANKVISSYIQCFDFKNSVCVARNAGIRIQNWLKSNYQYTIYVPDVRFNILNIIVLCLTRKEVDDYFIASETGTSKRNALSIFKIARKLLFIYGQEDKTVGARLAGVFVLSLF